MTKRTFLQLLSTAAAAPAGLLSAAGDAKLVNWAGNVTYRARRFEEARSLDSVRQFLRANKKVKVLGSRHCFNTIADTTENLLSLKPMHDMVALDRAARTVTVQAGAAYGQFCPHLDAQGFALQNLASLPHISVAGACATATHGSGENNGNLATAVSAIEFLNAEGDFVKLSRETDAEHFRGVVVGLGAIGVVTSVTLAVEPTYTVRQYVYQDLPLGEVASNFDRIEASGYSVSLFTDWQNHRVNELWIKVRDGAPNPFPAPAEYFGGKLAAQDLHPIASLSPVNCTRQMGVPGPWYDRLPHFRMGFTPSAGAELQSEYLVPRRHAVEAILAVERLRDRVSPHLLISEIRAVAADDLWMSTAYSRPSVAIHFTWKPDWPAVRSVLPVIERELSPFEPRPHWGKLFTLSPQVLRSRYEKLDAFLQLAKQHDPRGKFRNEFLDTNLFGPDV